MLLLQLISTVKAQLPLRVALNPFSMECHKSSGLGSYYSKGRGGVKGEEKVADTTHKQVDVDRC